MEMSIALPPKATSWKDAARAEELGYSSVWFYDTAVLNAEIFVAMGAAAMKTSKIKLCTGVTVPDNRLAPIVASALATLNALAPGRVVFGVSTGFTARRALGLKAVSISRMVHFINVVQGMLAGDTVEWRETGEAHKVRFLNPELGLINIEDPIPLAISALGPKGRATVAETGAQWITTGAIDLEYARVEMQDMRRLWAERGRDPKQLYAIAAFAGGRVLDEGEPFDSPSAMAQAGPGVAVRFHAMVEDESRNTDGFPFPDELEAYRKVYEGYTPADARYLSNHRGHLMFVRPDETHVTGPVIKAMSLIGTKAELVERLKAIKALGFSQVQFNLVPGHEHEMMERFADVMAQV